MDSQSSFSDFRLLFEKAPDRYLVLTPDLTIVAVSDAYAKATMTVREEVVGRNIFDVFPSNPANGVSGRVDPIRASFRRVLEFRRPDPMATDKYDIRRPDSEGGGFEERFWSAINTPILDEAGNVALIVHRVDDVTTLMRSDEGSADNDERARDQRAMIQQLRAANAELAQEVAARREAQEVETRTQAQFRFLFSNNPLPMWVYDKQTLAFLEVNDAALAKYGYSREEFAGMRITDIRPVEDIEPLLKDLKMPRAKLQVSSPWRHSKKDGTIIDVDISSHELAWNGRKAVLVVAEDISDRKDLEQQLRQAQKMEAVGQLTGGIAHDFNNLLGIITGNLDLLIERLESDPESTELAQEALTGALRGAELTQRMLAFARKQPLQPRILDLNEILPGMIGMLRRTLRDDIAVEMAPAESLWPAYCDRHQVEDAILNLAINARDAMPGGGKLLIETGNITLDEEYISRHVEVDSGDYVMLAVSDSGTGMTPEVIERAFEPFFTTKPAGQGTGLGLSMVYGFVRQSGGHVKIYSEVGYGTTIRLYLPRADDKEHAVARDQKSDVDTRALNHETILIVEDDEKLRRVAVKVLTGLGYAVLEAARAQAALDILEGGTAVDLLFTDIVMPGGITGFELAKLVKQRQPELKVLLTTGYSEAFVKNDEDHESIALIGKPYRKQDLAAKIRGMLDGTDTA